MICCRKTNQEQITVALLLMKVIDDILWECDKDNLTILVLLDYSKTYDKINHKTLLLNNNCVSDVRRVEYGVTARDSVRSCSL